MYIITEKRLLMANGGFVFHQRRANNYSRKGVRQGLFPWAGGTGKSKRRRASIGQDSKGGFLGSHERDE